MKDHRTYRYAIIKIGYGGWSAHAIPDTETPNQTSTLSGYGSGWREYLSQMDPDAPVVNLRAIAETDERLYVLACSGPMVDVKVPEGIVNGLGDTRPWDPRPVIGRPQNAALLGNARGLDCVGPRTYAMIAARMGAEVTTAAEEMQRTAAAA